MSDDNTPTELPDPQAAEDEVERRLREQNEQAKDDEKKQR